MKQNWKSILWIMSIGIIVRLVWVCIDSNTFRHLVIDDAYYYFAIAKNLAQSGMVSADGVTLTNGFHPLWLLVMTPFYWLGLGLVDTVRLIIGMGMVFDVMAALVIYKFLLKYGSRAAIIGLAAYYLNPVLIVQSMRGLETPLLALMVALWLYMVIRNPVWWKVGIVGGLLFLTRTDSIFLIIGGFLYLNYRYKAFPLRSAFLAGGIALPWLFWNYIIFGSIFQSSGSAYPWIYRDEFFNWSGGSLFSIGMVHQLQVLGNLAFARCASFYGGTIMIVIFLMAAINSKQKNLYWWPIIATIAMLLFHTFIRWYPRSWYFETFYIVSLIVIIPVIAHWGNKLLYVLGGIILCATLFTVSSKDVTAGLSVAKGYTSMASNITMSELVNKLPQNVVVGSWNSGSSQYFARDDLTVINLDGLANNDVLDSYKQSKFMEYLDKMNIRYIVDTETYMNWSFGKYFKKCNLNRIKLIHRQPLETRTVCIWKISEFEIAQKDEIGK